MKTRNKHVIFSVLGIALFCLQNINASQPPAPVIINAFDPPSDNSMSGYSVEATINADGATYCVKDPSATTSACYSCEVTYKSGENFGTLQAAYEAGPVAVFLYLTGCKTNSKTTIGDTIEIKSKKETTTTTLAKLKLK